MEPKATLEQSSWSAVFMVSHMEYIDNKLTTQVLRRICHPDNVLHAIMKVVRRHSSQKNGTHTLETFMTKTTVSGIPESLSVADCKIALV